MRLYPDRHSCGEKPKCLSLSACQCATHVVHCFVIVGSVGSRAHNILTPAPRIPSLHDLDLNVTPPVLGTERELIAYFGAYPSIFWLQASMWISSVIQTLGIGPHSPLEIPSGKKRKRRARYLVRTMKILALRFQEHCSPDFFRETKMGHNKSTSSSCSHQRP